MMNRDNILSSKALRMTRKTIEEFDGYDPNMASEPNSVSVTEELYYPRVDGVSYKATLVDGRLREERWIISLNRYYSKAYHDDGRLSTEHLVRAETSLTVWHQYSIDGTTRHLRKDPQYGVNGDDNVSSEEFVAAYEELGISQLPVSAYFTRDIDDINNLKLAEDEEVATVKVPKRASVVDEFPF